MSTTCGNCNCADKSQCVKKGNEYDVVVVGTEKSYVGDAMESCEHHGKCQCGTNCTCTDCSCSH